MLSKKSQKKIREFFFLENMDLVTSFPLHKMTTFFGIFSKFFEIDKRVDCEVDFKEDELKLFERFQMYIVLWLFVLCGILANILAFSGILNFKMVYTVHQCKSLDSVKVNQEADRRINISTMQ